MYGIEIGYTSGIKPPCEKDCKDRCATCHTECQAYIDYRKEKDKKNKEQYEKVSYMYERRAYMRNVVERYKKHHR